MVTFSTKSWHYRMAQIACSFYPVDCEVRSFNFCKYIRHVIYGLIIYSTITFLVSWLVVMNLFTLYVLVTTESILQPSVFTFTTALTLLACSVFGIAIFAAIVYDGCVNLYLRTKKISKSNTANQSSNVFKVWYKSKANKFCPQIEFKN